jgi:hypothetical protein
MSYLKEITNYALPDLSGSPYLISLSTDIPFLVGSLNPTCNINAAARKIGQSKMGLISRGIGRCISRIAEAGKALVKLGKKAVPELIKTVANRRAQVEHRENALSILLKIVKKHPHTKPIVIKLLSPVLNKALKDKSSRIRKSAQDVRNKLLAQD